MLNKIKKYLLYFFLLYAFFGFILFPLLLKPQIIKIVQETSDTKLQCESVYFNPFVFNFTLKGVKLKNLQGENLITFKEFFINMEPSSLLKGIIHIKKIELLEPYIFVELNKKKQINLLYLLKNSPQKPSKKEKNNWVKSIPHIIIESIKLKGGYLRYKDFTPKEEFDFSFDRIGFELQDIDTKDLKKCDIKVRFYTHLVDGGFLDLRSNIEGIEPFKISGHINFEASKLYSEWKYFQENLNLEIADGKISFHTDYLFSMADLNATKIENLSLSLDKLRVKPKLNSQDILHLEHVGIEGVTLFPMKHELKIQSIKVEQVNMYLKRAKNGTLDWQEYIKTNFTSSLKSNEKQEKEQAWNFKIKDIALEKLKLTIEDRGVSPSTITSLDEITLAASDLDIAKETWFKYKFSMRVNKKGYLKSDGSLQHTPLKQKGTFDLEKISLKELSPYIQEKAYISIDDGSISLKTKTAYSVSKNKPDLRVNGSFQLNNLYLTDSRDKSPLMAFSNVKLKSFTFELFPNRIYVDTMDIGSFYVDVLIDKYKRVNFTKLMKKSSNSKKEAQGKEVDFPIKIAKINISKGNVKFADLSIPIKFKTDIHNLKGAIVSVGNIPGEVSFVDLSGEVDKYGSTKLKGSVNSANPKEFTDLSFNFKNLELNAMSGYSASFAGYEIDSGKLYLDLGYKIAHSQLNSTNSVIIKHIKLGKESTDKNVTKLPLGLVIALLENSDGVIDIDLPIKGNLNAPDFKYGALVWQSIGNLIAKAVSSPFKFLGSMMGLDGDTLAYVEFEAGSAIILPTEREKLDNIVKMMLQRPKIELSLHPTFDKNNDKKAIQLQKLVDLVMQRSGISNKIDHQNAMTIDMLEAIYKDMSGNSQSLQMKKKQLTKEYKDKESEFDRVYLNALVEMTINLQDVSEKELITLAKEREKAINTYLISVKGIEAYRVLDKGLIKLDEPLNKYVQLKLEVEVK